jgi:hypothetical protein
VYLKHTNTYMKMFRIQKHVKKQLKHKESHLFVECVHHLHNQADFVLRVKENGVHSKMPGGIILMKAVNMVEPCLASVITITDKKKLDSPNLKVQVPIGDTC